MDLELGLGLDQEKGIFLSKHRFSGDALDHVNGKKSLNGKKEFEWKKSF